MYLVILIYFIAQLQTIYSEPCAVPCPELAKYNGKSQAILQINENVNIAYHPRYKIFLIDNIKDNLIFTPNSDILFLIDPIKKVYLVFDQRTEYVGIGKYKKIKKNQKNYSKLFGAINVLRNYHDTVDDSYPKSLNYTPIIINYFEKKFNLQEILPKDSRKLGKDLENNFKKFFDLIISSIRDKRIGPYRGVWNFIAVSTGLEMEMALNMIDNIRLLIEYFGLLPNTIIRNMIRNLAINSTSFLEFSFRLQDFLGCTIDATINQANAWSSNIMKTSVNFTLPVQFSINKFRYSYVKNINLLHFKIKQWPSGVNADITIFFFNEVMLMINKYTGLSISFYKKSFMLSSTLSSYAIIGVRENSTSFTCSFEIDSYISSAIESNEYIKASTYIAEKLSKYKSYGATPFGMVYKAADDAKIEEIAMILNVPLTNLFVASFGNFFEQIIDGTFGGIAIGVLGNARTAVASEFKVAINGIETTSGDWLTFTDFALKKSFSELRAIYRNK